MSDNTIRAVRYHSYGSPEVLVVERVPRPEPGAGEVLVRVHAAGVNPIDWKMRRGFVKLPLPATVGVDLAGMVDSIGPGVTDLQPGQEVYGGGRGTYADYAISSASGLGPKPRNLSFDQAAAIPVGVRAAWCSIFDAGGLQPGQTLLVHGAAGGVGLWAVQLGRWKGARVIGTASAANLEFVRTLGADTVVDYGSTPFESVARDVDVVLDTIGGEIVERSLRVIKPGGVYVTIVGPAPEERARQLGVRAARVGRRESDADLFRQVGELIESGRIAPVVQRVFQLEDARQAHELSETGHGRGRIVLHIAD
jgi:NADPH:quinone reductase-like Zn-dependent oxidoreductase